MPACDFGSVSVSVCTCMQVHVGSMSASVRGGRGSIPTRHHLNQQQAQKAAGTWREHADLSEEVEEEEEEEGQEEEDRLGQRSKERMGGKIRKRRSTPKLSSCLWRC